MYIYNISYIYNLNISYYIYICIWYSIFLFHQRYAVQDYTDIMRDLATWLGQSSGNWRSWRAEAHPHGHVKDSHMEACKNNPSVYEPISNPHELVCGTPQCPSSQSQMPHSTKTLIAEHLSLSVWRIARPHRGPARFCREGQWVGPLDNAKYLQASSRSCERKLPTAVGQPNPWIDLAHLHGLDQGHARMCWPHDHII
jgi:hypothetical protein